MVEQFNPKTATKAELQQAFYDLQNINLQLQQLNKQLNLLYLAHKITVRDLLSGDDEELMTFSELISEEIMDIQKEKSKVEETKKTMYG